MTFSLYAYRFNFRSLDRVVFPLGKAGNVFRGAFGDNFRRTACAPDCAGARTCPERTTCPYARLFEPRLSDGPSGLADPPRPFVFRAAHLNGRTLTADEAFHVDVHVFDIAEPALGHFANAFQCLAKTGFGPGRGRVNLESVTELLPDRRPGRSLPAGMKPTPLELSLVASANPVERLTIYFRTPTELRSAGDRAPVEDFAALFSRVRDRVSTLRALYGEGPLAVDFREMAQRARAVRSVRSCLKTESALRRSSRTGAVHSLSGVTGEVAYEGDLTEFVPLLNAGYWTGVGKHTVWGNGAIDCMAPA